MLRDSYFEFSNFVDFIKEIRELLFIISINQTNGNINSAEFRHYFNQLTVFHFKVVIG